MQSLNGDVVFNLNGSRLDFYSSALVRFYTGSNQLYRMNGDDAASVSFPTSMDTDIPMMVIGTDASGGVVDANSPSFQGLRVHGKDVGYSTNLVADHQLLILNRSDHGNGGFVMRTGYHDSVSRAFYPYDNPDNWTYNLGRSSSGMRFDTVYLKSSPNVSSDERLKELITDNSLGLDFINDIKTNQFRLIKPNNEEPENKMQFGIIAQQVIQSLDNYGVNINETSFVNIGEDGMYGVQYEQFIAPLIKSVQDVDYKYQGKVEELTQRVEELENGTA
ncbi:tail fiber domain-containing protein [Virgibacillus sp. CBA3643]|uniref:tail fiber domain-containing protein n=1 Tax=Virgibacillus sp. CBA3643 TaxID=2942278 RepID=UPI0035A31C26